MQRLRAPHKNSHKEPIKTDDSIDADMIMRRFIRHPSDIPINVDVIQSTEWPDNTSLINISRGGLCFESDIPLPIGTSVRIGIPIDASSFEVVGTVAWSCKEADGFAVGLTFDNHSAAFGIRMVEQVCYIEHYRKSIAECEGRYLSGEEAAAEWIDKYASDFHHH